jgi:hypothetical protein
MKEVLASREEALVLVAALSDNGSIMGVDAHSLAESLPSGEVLLRVPLRVGVRRALVGWAQTARATDDTISEVLAAISTRTGIVITPLRVARRV